MSDFDPIDQNEESPARGRKPKLKAGQGTVENVSRANEAHKREMPTRQMKAGGMSLYIDFPEHTKDEKEFFYYAVADTGGNVAKRKALGFEFALADDTGEKCSRVGSDGITMVLMRQPMVFRNEDLDLKRQAASAKVVSEQNLGDGQYIPDNRKNVIQRDADLDPFQM